MSRVVKNQPPRRAGRQGSRISSKHQVTIPIDAFAAAGLHEGDVVRIEAAGPGRVVLTRQDDLLDQFSGAMRAGGDLRRSVDELRDGVGVALLDSSAVVAFIDADDELHSAADEAVRRVAREHGLAVSTVTIAEVLTGAKLGHHDETIIRSFLAEVVNTRVPVDEHVAERAAELRADRRTLRMPDALILATGDLHADIVVTGDARWPKMRGLTCAVISLDS